MYRHACLIALIATLSACQLLPDKPTIAFGLPQTEELQKALAETVECAEQLTSRQAVCPPPAPAIRTLSKNFKYGRFCGKAHPRIPGKDPEKEKDLDERGRTELAMDYYRIKPIDDLDRACQAHDICWIVNAKPARECNEAFHDSLIATRKALRKQIGLFDTDTVQWRCGLLAIDMAYASFLFEEHYQDTAEKLGGTVFGWFRAPFDVTYAALFLATPQSNYPKPHERCNVVPPGQTASAERGAL